MTATVEELVPVEEELQEQEQSRLKWRSRRALPEKQKPLQELWPEKQKLS